MPTEEPEGYFASPENGEGPGVLVLHAWWGLNDTIKSICDQLATEGFVALAPDLYHGKVADTIPGAESLCNALNNDPAQAKADISSSVSFLKEHSSGDGLAVIGFSLGAMYALELATEAPDDISSVVLFYGSGEGDFTKAKASFLGHFAENDPYESKKYVDGLEQSIRDAGRPVTFYQYPGVGHWFFEPDRTDAYEPQAAGLAWERTLDFLKTVELTTTEVK